MIKRYASTITLNPRFIDSIRKAGWNRFNKERSQKAMSPDLAEKVGKGLENFSNLFFKAFGTTTEFRSDVDILSTLEVTVLHELMHTRAGEHADDAPFGKCYLWDNILKAKNENNAESLAYLAMIIQLINNFKLHVTQAGKVIGIGS
ncbi:uncharacterized protein LY79DRAFT_311178 [Colletotrichum navitas]|uniref:Uncharacterized protein n=1 Tax=Colletotrichum navitas TaxID=681940 RepID=A0AAD8PSZ9_9PEZI|nr:uncharacterized protein LY79DRAFT_311178 [Colletotrichum navitas]KAK1580188.1 hypothetical protein LY79DRAFT_311178 [Colletotrichum navitas]